MTKSNYYCILSLFVQRFEMWCSVFYWTLTQPPASCTQRHTYSFRYLNDHFISRWISSSPFNLIWCTATSPTKVNNATIRSRVIPSWGNSLSYYTGAQVYILWQLLRTYSPSVTLSCILFDCISTEICLVEVVFVHFY